MSTLRANSSPELIPSDANSHRDSHSSIVQGATAKVKLLLKLVQDYEDAARDVDGPAEHPGKPQHSIAGIICVLDDVKSGLERSQALAHRRAAELRRCRTELSRGKEQRQPETAVEVNQRLRKELSASLTARKSLEKMFSSLGKEKEIMAAELARKAHEIHDMEEHLSDLKAQNEKLLEKVQLCAAEHKEKKKVPAGESSLQDRNKALSDQLLKAVEGYRALKRKLKDAQAEKDGVQARVAEMAGQLSAGLDRIRDFCRRVVVRGDVEEEISSIEHMFRGLLANMSSAVAGVRKKTEVPATNEKPAVVA